MCYPLERLIVSFEYNFEPNLPSFILVAWEVTLYFLTICSYVYLVFLLIQSRQNVICTAPQIILISLARDFDSAGIIICQMTNGWKLV